MTHTYTISNTTANTSAVTLTSGGSSAGGYGAIPPLTASQVYTINTGGAGQIYTTTGTSAGFTWANTNDNVMIVKQTPPELEVKGRMVINGVDLEERLSTIEKVLQIPERDVKLEKKHPKLKKLYDEYIKELSKYRMWETIKGDE